MSDDGRKVEFVPGTKVKDGKCPHTEGGQKPIFSTLTQEEEAEVEDTSNISVNGEHREGSPFLTQAEDPFTLFNDQERRGSIDIPHIAVIAVDNDGEESLIPVHFFTKDGTIWVGNGLDEKKPCAVALSNNRKGKWMNLFALSAQAFQATSITVEETQKMRVKVNNRLPLILWSSHQNNQRSLSKGDELEVGDGDEIRFSKEAPYRKIIFYIPKWATPIDPAVAQAQEQAIAKIKEEEKQLEKSQMKLQKRSELLCDTEEEIKKCCTTKEVDAILSSMPPALIILPVEEASKLNRRPEDELSPPQQRGALGHDSKKPTASEPKRSSAESQELRRFMSFRQKVIAAERHLSSRPAKKNTEWERKAADARALLAEARKTPCFFYAHQGGCRDGHSCKFLHNSPQESLIGTITKVKQASESNSPYAFIRLDEDGKDLFAPVESFGQSFGRVRVGLRVEVHGTQPSRRPGRCEVAARVSIF